MTKCLVKVLAVRSRGAVDIEHLVIDGRVEIVGIEIHDRSPEGSQLSTEPLLTLAPLAQLLRIIDQHIRSRVAAS